MSTSVVSDMLSDIRRAYGSLDDPNFSFVGDALARRPYDDLVRRLRRSFTLEDLTDPNDDVSFGYLINGPEGRWHLSLSMVGPYALLLRLNDDGRAVLVSDDTIPASRPEAALKAILLEHGLRLLDRATLFEPIPLKLFSTDPDDVRLYQALFTDDSALPWEQPPRGAPDP